MGSEMCIRDRGEGATTLEWTVPSPPNFHTFDELPKVDVYEGAEKSKS